MKKKSICKTASTLLLATIGLFSGGTALALQPLTGIKILFVYDDPRGTTMIGYLTTLGATVTDNGISNPLPASLAGFNEVWSMQIFSAMTGPQQAELEAFVNGGGGLYLNAERPCCLAADGSDATIINALITGGGVAIPGNDTSDGSFAFNPTAIDGLTTTPNVLTSFVPGGPGLMTGITGNNILITGNLGSIVGGAWDQHNISSGKGRVMVVGDIDWVGNSSAAVVEAAATNFAEFLDLGTLAVTATPIASTAILVSIGLVLLLGWMLWRRKHAAAGIVLGLIALVFSSQQVVHAQNTTLQGTVGSLNGAVLVVRTTKADVSVTVTNSTVITSGGQPSSQAAIKPGAKITVAAVNQVAQTIALN